MGFSLYHTNSKFNFLLEVLSTVNPASLKVLSIKKTQILYKTSNKLVIITKKILKLFRDKLNIGNYTNKRRLNLPLGNILNLFFLHSESVSVYKLYAFIECGECSVFGSFNFI